jgi:Tfp pilus assembly protein PilV
MSTAYSQQRVNTNILQQQINQLAKLYQQQLQNQMYPAYIVNGQSSISPHGSISPSTSMSGASGMPFVPISTATISKIFGGFPEETKKVEESHAETLKRYMKMSGI